MTKKELHDSEEGNYGMVYLYHDGKFWNAYVFFVLITLMLIIWKLFLIIMVVAEMGFVLHLVTE